MGALSDCFEDADIPYQPFVQLLVDDLAGLPDHEVHRRVGGDVEGLSRIVPDVARGVPTQSAA